MKKLMFATALVASAAAFADTSITNAVGFESYALGPLGGNNAAENNEFGTGPFFYFHGDSNSSVVTNESPSTTQRTAYFAEANNTKYLALDTEGGTLWRSINPISSIMEGETPVYGLGTAQAVAADGTYLDTLVQFTVTEDDAPEVGGDDKLAIWLGIDTNGVETTTNLMVKAGLIDDQGGITETTFKIGGAVEPGVWYRLTVKALADITDNSRIPGFQIYLDGTLLTSSTPTLTSEFLEILSPDDVDDSHYADIVAGKYFASLKTATTIQGVGFMGTGAVDEIVWTTENPIAAPAPEYPTYIDTTDTTIKDKYDAWKTKVGFDDSSTSTHLNQFLLDVDEETTVGDTALEITEIKENATAGWDITIGCTVSGASLTGTVGETIVCNGYLAVSYTDNLAGTWTTENIAITAVDATAGTVTVNVNKSGAKFMKVSLTVAPQAAPGGAGAGE